LVGSGDIDHDHTSLTLLKIRTLEHFQTELEGNQVDCITKPRTLQRGQHNVSYII
jgi:hypothetical protein